MTFHIIYPCQAMRVGMPSHSGISSGSSQISLKDEEGEQGQILGGRPRDSEVMWELVNHKSFIVKVCDTIMRGYQNEAKVLPLGNSEFYD